MSKLIVKESSIKGAGKGCFADRDYKEGERLGEYVGELVTPDESDERFAEYGQKSTYMFELDDGDTIDATPIEHPIKYINHSCDPNSESEEIENRVYISAIKDIKEGEEIFYDYNLIGTEEDDEPCYCGADNCRGTFRDLERED